MRDKIIEELIKKEEKRQSETINLIASENYVSKGVRGALGSVFVNKYAEGYPGARYYGGNEVVDKVENLVKKRALKLFRLNPGVWDVNVQPYSGSPANLAVYLALVPTGAKIMGMKLSMGGHLTHGSKVSVSGKLWEQVPYGVDRISEKLDYGEILNMARIERPRLIIAGAAAYSRTLDFEKFRAIADDVKALLFVDMSHIAGLVAGGAHQSPFYARGGQALADVVMTTTHKTLRGPRAALIFSREEEIMEKINKMVFPGLQGGPHINQIAAVGVALNEAMSVKFKEYARQAVRNAKTLSAALQSLGWRIISGGTDTHLFLVDVSEKDLGGGEAEKKLERVGIIVNKNTIPFDERSPRDPSGIRIGTPAVTTRGMREREMRTIAKLISKVLFREEKENKIHEKVLKLCKKFSVPK